MNKRSLFLLMGVMVLAGCAGVRSAISPNVPEGKSGAYYFLLSEIEAERDNPSKALLLLDKAIEKKEGDPSYLLYKRAFLYAAQGDLKKAEEDLQKVLTLQPDDRSSLLLLGKIKQGQDHRKEAIALYQKALQWDPSSDEVNILLLESYVAEKNERSALDLIHSWEKRDPDNLSPLFYEAWVYRNLLNQPARAVPVYRKILGIEPDNVKALSSLAEIYLNQKEDQKVLEIFDQMSAKEPNDVSIPLRMALIYYEHKQYDRAIHKFQELLKVYPDADRIIYYLGVVYENLKRDEEAIGQFQKIKPNSTFFKEAELHQAFLLMRGEKKEEAIHLLGKAIETKPEVADFYQYLSEIYRDGQDFPKAIEVLKKGLSKSPDQESLLYNLGMVYDRKGQFEDCIRSMRKVLALNPQNASAMNYIGYSYADRGIHLEEALGMIQMALNLKPDDGYITDSLGWAYYRKGDLDQAVVYIQKAYQLVPNEPTITEHLGDVFLGKKDAKKALKYFQEAVTLLEKGQPEKPETVKDLERVRKKINELKKN